jgi:hypothetical protein
MSALIRTIRFIAISAKPNIFSKKNKKKNDILKRNEPIRPARKTMKKNLLVKIFNRIHSRAAQAISMAKVFKPKGVERNSSAISERTNI